MEPKEKQRIYAQTFVPSVERFDDNHSLIQLASKARDKVAGPEVNNSKPAYKYVPPKKSLSNFSPPLATGIIKSPDVLNPMDKQAQECLPDRNFQKNGGSKVAGSNETAVKSDCANMMPKDKRFSENASPRYTQDVKHGTHVLSTKRTSPFSKPVSPYKEPRQITSISACMYTPGPKSPEMKGHLTAVRQQMKDHMPGSEQQMRNMPVLSSAEEKADLKDAKQPMRFFRSQSERPKLERNRGNQKLPVGIAVARQRQHTTPAKPRTAVKSRSPDLERRYHEHTLNQEREVLLRENKELSNYTSRLQTSSTNPPSLPMLNLQNAMLPGAWEREQAIMSSIFQWQQAQSSLLGTNLPHPSMWLGGTSPYHLPGNHTGTSLASAQSSTSGYPLLSSGLSGGFVIMPQLLQDPGAASMWSSLAALYQSAQATSTNLPNPFHNVLSQRLNLPHELQAIQQRAMLPQGIPFPLHKGEGSLPDSHPLTSFPTRLHTPDGDRSTHSPCRIDPSPKNARTGPTPNWPHGERRQRSPVRSPPTRTPNIQQKTTNGSVNTARLVLSKADNITANSVIQRHHSGVEHPKPRMELNVHQVPQILDLTSSPEDYSSVRSAIKAEKNNVKHERTSPANMISPHHYSKEESKIAAITEPDINHNTEKVRLVVPSVEPVNQKVAENVPETAETKPQNMPMKEDFFKITKPCVVSGVELLSQAADIHSQNMIGNTQPSAKRKHPERPSSHPARLYENTEGHNDDKMATKEYRPQVITKTAEGSEQIDIATLDPDVLDAVRGITLLSQSLSQRKLESTEPVNAEEILPVPVTTEQNQFDTERYREPHPSVSDCNDDVQSTVSFSSITDSAIISGDCLSSSELKDQETREKVRLKRKLKKPISSKLKFAKDDGPIAGATFKLDSMDAKEIDMKMRLADLQRRYKEKQKELAKIQRRNKKEKHDSNSTHSSSVPVNLTSPHMSGIASSPYSSPKFKFGETTPLTAPTPKKSATPTKTSKQTISQGMFSSKRKRSADSDKDNNKSKVQVTVKPTVAKLEMKTLFEKFTPDIMAMRKSNEETTNAKEDNENEPASDHQPIPSGSRKRKPEKPKRICLPPGETSTVPLVEPSKKNLSTLVSIHEERKPTFPNPKSEKKRKRKMKHASKKIKLQVGDDPATSSWVFKSKNKSEKNEGKIRKKSEMEKSKSQKSQSQKSQNANLSNNNNRRKKSRSISKEKVQPVPSPQPEIEQDETPVTPQLELREEDLVKGLQVLVPLEDKLLYLCQINPIQPPDIYEVTVEGERHRHRPIVMCLEQILKEAVPDVKPRSAQDVCEGSRVAAYWSHKMHCLYTGTIAFDDSDDEEEEKQEGMVQVEFDDGDSSMIPLDDIRLLPRNYPIMQPDAPFMMHYVHRRRNTSEISTRDANKTTQSRVKKPSNQGQDKKEEKARKKSEKPPSKSQKSALDLSAYDYPSTDDVDQAAPTPRKRVASLKSNSKSAAKVNSAESSASSISSAEEDSDTVFSDSSDDTYEGDDGDVSVNTRLLPKYKNRGNLQNPSNELWTWHDKDVQKKAVKGRAKKIYHKSIRRGDEVISCGDSAVFLSAGRLYLPYIGRIESMWESWGNNMVVKVRWFYHPEETKRGRVKSHGKHPLYKSSHIDENDVQTISHKCEVVSFKEYCRRMRNGERNVFYCAGTYDPSTGQVIQEHTDKRKHQKS